MLLICCFAALSSGLALLSLGKAMNLVVPTNSSCSTPKTTTIHHSHMSVVSLLQPSLCQRKTRSYAKILIGSRLFLTAMAIHLSLRVAPPDLQQGYDSRIPYVHVPAARMSIVVYIATAINSFLFPLTKHPLLFLRSSGTGTEIGAFSTLFTLVTGGFRGRPMWSGVGCSFNFCIHLVPYLPGCTAFSKASCRTGSYFSVFNPCWTDRYTNSLSYRYTNNKVSSQLVEYIASTWEQTGTSIHVPMLIPILSNFANSPFSTRILFVLETRLLIPSFPESPLTEERRQTK